MDSYINANVPGFSLPFQRQRPLSRLYNDTKKSSDFVKEPVQHAEDPEIKALHRKLRIQKDRFVSWGLEWSDPGGQQSSASEVLIDSSISRAGLSEVVASIMSTIKETLSEVEHMWPSSSKAGAGGGDGGGGAGEGDSGKAPADKKVVAWDKARFTDLVKDLTMSIDTLYDLTRSRSAAAAAASAEAVAGGGGSKGGWKSAFSSSISPSAKTVGEALMSSSDDSHLFESTRMQVPKMVNPATLSSLPPSHPDSPVSKSRAGVPYRDVVVMSKQAFAELTRAGVSGSGSSSMPYAPLLLEYAYFDSVYANTGVMPPMARFERLSAALQQPQPRQHQQQRHTQLQAWYGLPRLLGYFEDMEHSRLGLVYHFPLGFHAVLPGESAAAQKSSTSPSTSLMKPSPNANPRSCIFSLRNLLASPNFEPTLEAKFRLAYNLAHTVFDMHARGIVHGNLMDSNVLFGLLASTSQARIHVPDAALVDLRRPLISSFDLFPDTATDDKTHSNSLLFRHPLNPLTFLSGEPPIVDVDPKVYDLYSLAMLLLSIGLWTSLDNFVSHQDATTVSDKVLRQLALQCGMPYMRAVKACWNAIETLMSAMEAGGSGSSGSSGSGNSNGDAHLKKLETIVGQYLEACCMLDTVGDLGDQLWDDARGEVAVPVPVPMAVADAPERRTTATASATKTTTTTTMTTTTTTLETKVPTKPSAAPKPESKKMRLYPQVPLSAEAVDKWHNVLMPQINHALRSFYRSHPESVEISLESVGDSIKTTKPTVLVVCTSVSKVRHILKRKMGAVFDGTSSDFALKVCTGRVLRSRKRGAATATAAGSGAAVATTSAAISAAMKSQLVPANNHFQERPQNGASIGAWIGDRHLPPVSFGGLVLVDGKPYGMTVHHMLDDPDGEEGGADDNKGEERVTREAAAEAAEAAAAATAAATADGGNRAVRSSAAAQEIESLTLSLLDWYAEQQRATGATTATTTPDAAADASSSAGNSDDDYACEFSDAGSAVSDSDNTSEWSYSSDGDGDGDVDGDKRQSEPGDTPGVEPGYGEGYVVTQPALDDVSKDFYPDADTEDEDHLDSCGLGDIYASSGLRRRVDERGLVHEIDWALFEFRRERLPSDNVIPHLPMAERRRRKKKGGRGTLHPTTVAPGSALPGLAVQCMARTSGLQTGRILPTLTSVKIYGRTSPSHTYQISGTAGVVDGEEGDAEDEDGDADECPPVPPSSTLSLPIGVPGDSGAWIVEREHGRLCGHVLAWSERKKVSYLCPMDVMLLDIAETLAADEVRLPGGEAVVKMLDTEERKGARGSSSGTGGGGSGDGGGGGSSKYSQGDSRGNNSNNENNNRNNSNNQGNYNYGGRSGSGSVSVSASMSGGSARPGSEVSSASLSSRMRDLAGSLGYMHLGGSGNKDVPTSC